ncbi:MAG TPA: diaminopimelate decarboxylase [Bryobacteraceae bacterium]|jgi:diaminopimelate decarboxylase|nr:diaminopimelate decarboxylase [Bryobacteraceae bacterium]
MFCEAIDLHAVAREYGTPAYVYSASAIRLNYQAYENGLADVPHRICFAVKSNSNLAVLSLLAQEGAGFDIVSGGELFRVLAAGGDPAKVVFSGVGKTEEEIRFALEHRIHSFNCESEAEISLISRIATDLGCTASIAIRVNPDVDATTHPYISTGLREHKFGIDIDRAEDLYLSASLLSGVAAEGVSCHIGSQLLSIEPVLEAADKVLALIDRLQRRGLPIRYLDLGGGLGVPYRKDENGVPISVFVEHILARTRTNDLTLMLEPGRSIVAEAGILLTRVLLVKENGRKTFVIVDAAMNDLLRPALYQAHHEIEVLPSPLEKLSRTSSASLITADIVGPVCETGDFFARDRTMSRPEPGDLITIKTAGAYGFVLSSNYNSRPRACELLVDGSRIHIARKRETYEDLIRGEAPALGHTVQEDDRFAGDRCKGPA